MIQTMRKAIGNKEGSAIFQFIIIVAIVAILAVTTLPSLNDKITESANGSIDRIENIDGSLEN